MAYRHAGMNPCIRYAMASTQSRTTPCTSYAANDAHLLTPARAARVLYAISSQLTPSANVRATIKSMHRTAPDAETRAYLAILRDFVQ